MRILYLTNIPAPYRVVFFNQLSCQVELKVIYQSLYSVSRESKWLASIPLEHNYVVLDGVRNERGKFNIPAFIRMIVDKRYDLVVIGCYNEPLGILAIEALKACGKTFLVNIDGEYFDGPGLNKKLRNHFVKKASGFLIAGERTGTHLKSLVRDEIIYPYHFSSLTEIEVSENAKFSWQGGESLLCVGQYAAYKGIDILVEAMTLLPDEKLTIVGASSQINELSGCIKKLGATNVDVIPFLSKSELGEKYRSCKALVLPSRQECWGLVINEAASYGTPIISTKGAGAALEFLGGDWDGLLAEPKSLESLAKAIYKFGLLPIEEVSRYSRSLIRISKNYTIEKMVAEHIKAFDAIVRL